MNHPVRPPIPTVCASFLFAAMLVPGSIYAADQEKTNPLQFYTGDNGSYAKVTLEADLGFFTQDNSWFGNSEAFLGKKSDSWWETLVRPGLDVSFTLPSTQTIYGQIDAVQANTFGGVDAAGTNVDDEDINDLRIDRAFAGWRSGNLFGSLGDDFLDVSFGRQRYVVGDGFLFGSESYAGFNRAAYWIGGRNTADYAGIVRMKSGAWSSDLVYFKADDRGKTDTTLGGANLNYTVEKVVNIGGGFYVLNSDTENRDGMQVYNLRGGINPFALAGSAPAALKPLRFDAEYVHEDAGNRTLIDADNPDYANGDAWNVSVSYQFETTPWKPTLIYRYASFDENYDPLFYGSTDWGNWYQGEILGEYALLNQNLDSHMLKLKFQPIDPVTVNLIYYQFMLHEAQGIAASDDYADEYNLIVDWAVNDHLSLSVVGGIADPDDAAVELTGGNDNWSYLMLFGAVKF
jgi:hypothetical protein